MEPNSFSILSKWIWRLWLTAQQLKMSMLQQECSRRILLTYSSIAAAQLQSSVDCCLYTNDMIQNRQ